MTICVYGNHECGLETSDKNILCDWLIKPFRKDVTVNDIIYFYSKPEIKFVYNSSVDYGDVEYCTYYFILDKSTFVSFDKRLNKC